ncbi:MAG: methyl-accepting chemotaxis protein [Nitrospiria bacterium]
MWISNKKIGTRLWMGFGLVFVSVFILTLVAIDRANLQSELVERLHTPSVVGHALREIKANVIALQFSRNTQDSRTFGDFEEETRMFKKRRESIDRNTVLLNEWFTTDEKKRQETIKTLQEWTAIQDAIFEKRLAGIGSDDQELASEHGKSSRLFTALESRIDALTDIMQTDEKRVYDMAQDTKSSTVLAMWSLFLLVVIIGGVTASAITRSIIKGLAELTDTAKEVANGDLNVRSTYSRRDEIGVLSEVFNTMTQNLYQLVSQVQKGALQVSSASEALSSSSEKMNENSEEVERQTETVSSISEEASLSFQSVSTATEEMSVTIKEISVSVQEAALITKQAVKMAGATNDTISKLGESSTEIGKVSKVISSIAQQTNLLALNATIEAARAGAAGKGFAVVANEVKELAKATANATEEISEKISAIQDDTHGAVSAIMEIGEVIEKINEISTSIAASIEEQAVTTNEITHSVAEAASGTHKVAQSINEVANASKSTAEAASSVLTASQGLSTMGTELLTMVNKFQLHLDDLEEGSFWRNQKKEIHAKAVS